MSKFFAILCFGTFLYAESSIKGMGWGQYFFWFAIFGVGGYLIIFALGWFAENVLSRYVNQIVIILVILFLLFVIKFW